MGVSAPHGLNWAGLHGYGCATRRDQRDGGEGCRGAYALHVVADEPRDIRNVEGAKERISLQAGDGFWATGT